MTVSQLIFFSLLMLACGSAPSQHQNTTDHSGPKPLLNIRDIADQTQEDIATILGPQSSLDPEKAARSRCPNCQKYSYQEGTIEITYINDMADWITIYPPKGTPARQTPILLGLPDTPPDSTSPSFWRWNQIPSIQELRAQLNPAGSVESIYIIVKTL
ncbi:hypothetical protein [Salmonirosea aquatica]|uniref:Lipoprotein n=1 Tax=Salmonirosea aquatica TaxID=2654236 RepID=A0A7C9BP82_9BACT|nr:hypothetical protein [Cytophagaceae bacterium SJW1-29]